MLNCPKGRAGAIRGSDPNMFEYNLYRNKIKFSIMERVTRPRRDNPTAWFRRIFLYFFLRNFSAKSSQVNTPHTISGTRPQTP